MKTTTCKNCKEIKRCRKVMIEDWQIWLCYSCNKKHEASIRRKGLRESRQALNIGRKCHVQGVQTKICQEK